MFINQSRSVLIIDDEFGIRDGLKQAMEGFGFSVTLAESGESGIHEFRKHNPFDLVITDYKMPGLNGFDVLREIKKLSPETPVVLMTGHGSIHHAVNAIQSGATDYLCKPFSLSDIERILNRFKPIHLIESEGSPILTRDPKMEVILRKAQRVAKSDTPVLIEGPSGTGKELLARQIHEWSSRKGQAWVAINCAALPAGLLESELFGFEKGAFTGAIERKIGKFELADGGTLLLDEIGELDPLLQAKLLRVLQEGEVDRIGGRKPTKIDVRIIATTNKNLERLVKEDKFREDLYFRLYGVKFELPALRERPLDIRYLAEYFLQQQSKHLQREFRYQEGTLEALVNYPWMGNIRELERSVQRAAVLSESGLVSIENFELGDHKSFSIQSNKSIAQQRPASMKDMERDAIIQALEENQGNRTHTAQSLGMSLRTLRHKLKQYKEEGFLVEAPRQNRLGKNSPAPTNDAGLSATPVASTRGWEIAQSVRGEL